MDEVKKENPNSLKTINQTHTIIFSEHVTIDKKRIEIWDERKCARLKLFSRKLFEQNECPKYRYCKIMCAYKVVLDFLFVMYLHILRLMFALWAPYFYIRNTRF